MPESPAARSMATPGSAPTCPGCAKAIDPLRAGHVAIFDGQFLYYCDARCKASHLLAIAQHIGDDVATLDPPAVAERVASMMPVSGEVSRTPFAPPVSRSIARNGAEPQPDEESESVTRTTPPPATQPIPSFPTLPSPPLVPRAAMASTPLAPPVSPVVSIPPVRSSAQVASSAQLRSNGPASSANGAPSGAIAPSSPASGDETHPTTLRSPAPSLSDASAPQLAPAANAPAPERAAPKDRSARAVAMAGLLAGLLVPALSIAGENASAAQLPLVLLASLAVIVRTMMAPRDPADASPLLATLPVAVAAAAALAAGVSHAPHATAIAWFAGLAAAGALFVELSIARARREIDQKRETIARAFEAPVRVVRGDAPSFVAPAQVKPGEHVVVEADELVGVDGIVAAGDATVVPWLGAPIEMTKTEGDPVVAGARVVSGRLRLRTTWAGQERAWAKLVLSNALRVDVSSPIVRTARAVLERGTPVAAVLVGIAAFANGSAWIDVIAAACAAALAAGGRGVVGAVALVKARGQLAALEHGVIYKDARAFDEAGRTDVAVVCSRGTVLMGDPEIVALEPLGPENARLEVGRLLALAAGAETASTHPFAAVILRAARARGERPDNVRSATVHAGLGVTALASNGEHLVVGSRALLLQEKVSVALADARISELEAQGRSVLLVALAGKLVGLFAMQDGLRAGARAAVQRLLDARIEPVLLSGEARETCETLGRALDIEHIRPEVLPLDRGTEVRALGEGGHVVAVIGHPSTDDGALGAADVAIAMCSAGATPGEWAVALASDDVRDAALALGFAHSTRDRARITLALGLAPGALALLVLAFGIAGILVAPILLVAATSAALLHARR